MFSRRLRIVLLLAGLALVSFSIAMLVYAYWPTETLREQMILAPTIFAPP